MTRCDSSLKTSTADVTGRIEVRGSIFLRVACIEAIVGRWANQRKQKVRLPLFMSLVHKSKNTLIDASTCAYVLPTRQNKFQLESQAPPSTVQTNIPADFAMQTNPLRRFRRPVESPHQTRELGQPRRLRIAPHPPLLQPTGVASFL